MEDSKTNEGPKVQVRFTTQQSKYAIADTPIMIPVQFKKSSLSQIINQILDLDTPVKFEFLIDGKFLKGSLKKYLDDNNLSSENQLLIEYIEAMQPPQSLPSYQHDDWISSVSINSKKNLILTGSYDKVARIWDLSGNCISNLLGHTAPVKTVSWVEKNGTYCITGSNDNTVRIWEFDETTGNSTPKYECKGHEGTIEDIAVSKSNDYFATASYDSNIKIWGMNSSLDKEEEEENDEDVESKQKKRKISSDIKIKNSMATLKGHNNGVTCIVFDKNTYTLYSGGNDHSLRFWNIEARSNTFTMNCEKVINCIDFSDHNNLLATGHSDKFIRIWDSRIKEGSSVKLRLSSHNKWVSSLKWSPKSPYMLVSGSYDSSVKFWDIRSSTSPLYTIKGGNELDDKVLCVDWVNDLVATGGSDTILRLHSTSGIDLTNTQ